MCNGFMYILPIILFSVLYNIPKFYEVATEMRCRVLQDGTVSGYFLYGFGKHEPCMPQVQLFPAYVRTKLRDTREYSIVYIGVSNCLGDQKNANQLWFTKLD